MFQENIRYIENYQSPDSRVILKGNLEQIIFIPITSINSKRIVEITRIGVSIRFRLKNKIQNRIVKLKAREDYRIKWIINLIKGKSLSPDSLPKLSI